MKEKTIAIVGGGPGGLTLARLLQLKDVQVKVYERDVHKDARQQGTTLDLHEESGLKALAEAQLMDAFKRSFRPGADKIRVVDHNAKIFFDDHVAKPEDDFGNEHFRPEIDRGPLRNILLESLRPGTVVWNSQFETMSKIGDTWELKFANGTTARADVVVGADGANSKIRPFVTPVKSFYSGVTALEGAVYDSESNAPKMHALLKGGKIFAFGGNKCLIVSSKGDGGLAFYTSCRTAEDWVTDSGIDFSNKIQMLEWFKRDFSGWDTLWHELFENCQGYFIPRPIYCMPLDQHWNALSNLTLLGDAAHLMPPFAGEGVNMAMLDALELSDYLTHAAFANVQSAIAGYEKQMRKRASEAAHASLINTEWMHEENAIDKMLGMFGRG